MWNLDKWHPNEDEPIELDLDDEPSDRIMAYGIVGAISGLLILCAIASMAINQFLWN
ncbi:hypothetical protein ACOTF6_09360 [Achromobacter xylosoxidans]